jgi:hypothetical protein
MISGLWFNVTQMSITALSIKVHILFISRRVTSGQSKFGAHAGCTGQVIYHARSLHIKIT